MNMHKLVSGILTDSTFHWSVWEHSKLDGPITNPSAFATAIGYELDRIAKTVMLANRKSSGNERRSNPELHLGAACLPTASKMDMKAVAREFGWSSCELAKVDELQEIVDYPPKGVSPIGLHPIRLIVDDSLMKHASIVVGAGVVGVEVELHPSDLATITACSVGRIRKISE